MTEKRTCQQCGDTIRGRSDKRFCDDTCRNRFHNKVNSDEDQFIRQVNSILKRNRKILRSVWPEGSEYLNCDRQDLLRLGFRFGYHTHSCRSAKGQPYHFCYEFGYTRLRADSLVVVKREPHLEQVLP
jgi:hypothetical protein